MKDKYKEYKDMTNSEHLQWLHDRIVNVYGESENVDFLIKFREIIKDIKDEEDIKYVKENIMKGLSKDISKEFLKSYK
jgi:hypothetical protein